MLPFLGGAALYVHFRRSDPALRPSLWWTLCLSASALAMTAAGAYQVVTQLFK
jgi:hypothetical protein